MQARLRASLVLLHALEQLSCEQHLLNVMHVTLQGADAEGC